MVCVQDVGKRFKLYGSARDRLLDFLHIPPRPRYQEFWAVRGISFAVRRGECVGVIGPNGAGKSTLLKMLTGSLYATSGSIQVSGKVLSLLELGTGFTPELSGRQNIEQSARLLGFPPGYAAERGSEIQAFAELGEYFDRPVKFYSSGMLVRLAFSLFSTMQPEVFLVDEALAVGDMRFAAKAFGRIRSMLDGGTTLLFVSHDLHLINQLCTRTLWLHSGTLQMDGPPSEVTRAYQQFVVHGELEAPSIFQAPSAEADKEEEDHTSGPDRVAELRLGRGWYAPEAYAGVTFRWAAGEAELIVPGPQASPRELLLELEPGPSVRQLPAVISVETPGVESMPTTLAGRDRIRTVVPSFVTASQRVRVVTHGENAPVQGDGRVLSFRAFGWAWADQGGELRSILEASDWLDNEAYLDLTREHESMHQAIERCVPRPGARARITRVVTRNAAGDEAVRFSPHERLSLEITIEAQDDVARMVAGVQVRDLFDRMLWTTRTDWQTRQLPSLRAGQSTTVVFCTDRLLLGTGYYQLTVACHEYPRDDQVFHWVDGVWKFQVLGNPSLTFAGTVDLGWRYALTPDASVEAL